MLGCISSFGALPSEAGGRREVMPLGTKTGALTLTTDRPPAVGGEPAWDSTGVGAGIVSSRC